MYMLSTVISQTGECNAQHATDPCFLNQWGYSTRENALYSFLNLLYIYLTPILSFHLINKIFIFHLQYYLSTFT